MPPQCLVKEDNPVMAGWGPHLNRCGANSIDPTGHRSFINWNIFCFTGAMTPPINYYRANLNVYFDKKYIEDKVPMLVANASDDTAISPTLLDVIKSQYAQIETILIDNVGHFSLSEQPEKVIKIIRDFLNKHNIK